jgi:hypothetical protein
MRTNVLISKTELGKASSRAPVQCTALQAVQMQLPATQYAQDSTAPGYQWQHVADSVSSQYFTPAADSSGSMCSAWHVPLPRRQSTARSTPLATQQSATNEQFTYWHLMYCKIVNKCAVVLQVKRTTFNNSSPDTTYGAAMPHDAEGAWQGGQAQAYYGVFPHVQ